MNAIPFTWHLLHPRYWPVWLVIVPLLYLFSLLPWAVQRRLGTGLGLLIYHVIGQRKRDTETNIRLCFPEKSAARTSGNDQRCLCSRRHLFIRNR
jgi:KDO2-lipid IV(A) lauroyltransferase